MQKKSYHDDASSRPERLAEIALRALTAPHHLRDQANRAMAGVGSDDHIQALDRVARARCAEWLEREHGMGAAFARTLVDEILSRYADSTRVRR